jgi:hypothetical protein
MLRLAMSFLPRACATFAAAAVIALAATHAHAATQGTLDYRNERFGFSLSVPADIFLPGEPRNPELGMLWISRDGLARLVVVAAPNETGGTMEDYRRFVMQETYAGAKFDYTPTRDNWFVLSGTMRAQTFYERITFVCGGRFVYGWQLHYPSRQRRLYDRVVEDIHRTYQVGQGDNGRCD